MPPPAQCRPGRMSPFAPPSRRHCADRYSVVQRLKSLAVLWRDTLRMDWLKRLLNRIGLGHVSVKDKTTSPD